MKIIIFKLKGNFIYMVAEPLPNTQTLRPNQSTKGSTTKRAPRTKEISTASRALATRIASAGRNALTTRNTTCGPFPMQSSIGNIIKEEGKCIRATTAPFQTKKDVQSGFNFFFSLKLKFLTYM